MKKINVAIMGIGTVGGGTFDILTKNHDLILRTQNVDINVVKVLDLSPQRVADRTGNINLAVTSLADIINDNSISIVVETMGGVEPARTFIKKVLESGKSIVTANKELLAKHWPELEESAKKGKAGLYFEASCVGGVPIIRTLTDSMQANKMQEIMGIINGTTNYIITKMTEEGMSYEDALRGAQALGFAESDPTADVEGFDAMYKISILSSLAFHTCIPFTEVYREGITKVRAKDIKHGAELGYTLKLLAIGKRSGNNIEARVHPTFIPSNHPLAAVRNEFNAVFLKGNYVDDIMMYGKGAGSYPTGSAIVSDIVFCAKTEEHRYSDYNNNGKLDENIKVQKDFVSKYYIALTAVDKSGVLAKITEILGRNNVSINNVTQNGSFEGTAPIIFITHDTNEQAITVALKEIGQLTEVKSLDSLIRIL